MRKFICLLFLSIFLTLSFSLFADNSKHTSLPQWATNKFIYEVNIRQFSQSGNFAGVKAALPRLQKLGVGILWLMPIHPIGIINRKGSLGSPYSVKDYYEINLEFGSEDDFRDLIDAAHSAGIKVILDWVANHTSWDNLLTSTHPDYYNRDQKGNFYPPNSDWSDVIGLNYNNEDLRQYMIGAMEYWVREFGIDGFRCDVASLIPTTFWEDARKRLEQIKPVLMLAEAENADLQSNAFDLTYSWDLYFTMKSVVKGEKDANAIWDAIARQKNNFPTGALELQFTTNHDENSSGDLILEKMGTNMGVFIVLSATIPGVPLIYDGQEAGIDYNLSLFDRTSIVWKDHPFNSLYSKLCDLKNTNHALDAGGLSYTSGNFNRIYTTDRDNAIISYIRDNGSDEIFVLLNVTNSYQSFTFKGNGISGKFKEIMNGYSVEFKSQKSFYLNPWEYLIFVKQ